MTSTDPQAALQSLIAVYSMPLRKTQAERHEYGNQILTATEGHFDKWSPFVGVMGGIIATMQELPHFYSNLNRSTTALVVRYRHLALISKWIKYSGLAVGAGGAGAVNAGATEAVKTGSLKAAAKKASARIAGYGSLPEAINQRFGAKLPKGGGTGISVLAIAGVTIVLYSAEREMSEIKAIMMHRFKKGQATDAEYKSVFQDGLDPVQY